MFRSGSACSVLIGLAIVVFFPPVAHGQPGVVVSRPMTYVLNSPINTLGCMDIDHRGRMYVADHGRHTIMRFNLTGDLEESWPYPEHEAEFADGPRGIRVLADGKLLLGPSIRNWSVRRIGPERDKDVVTPLADGDRSQAGFWGFSDGGYVSRTNDYIPDEPGKKAKAVANLFIYRPNGKLRKKITMPNIDAVAVGPDDMIYLLNCAEKKILVEDLDGGLLRTVDISPAFPGQLPYYLVMCVDTNSDIYLSDRDRFFRIDSTGKQLTRWNRYHPRENDGAVMTGMRVCNGLVYAYSDHYSLVNTEKPDSYTGHLYRKHRIIEILVYTSDGMCVARYVPKTLPLTMPASIAVQSDGSYAVVQFTNSLHYYSPKGEIIDESGGNSGMDPWIIARPEGGYYVSAHLDGLNAVTTRGELIAKMVKHVDSVPGPDGKYPERKSNYYCDYPGVIALHPSTGNIWSLGPEGTLAEFAPDGPLLRCLGWSERLRVHLWSHGMVIDKKGFIYRPDVWKHRIVKMDTDGNIITTWGKQGSGLGEMKYPEGIAIDAENRIYVTDCENNRIQVFTNTGEPLGVFGRRGSGDWEFDRPFALTIGPNDTLWISDTFNDRIVKIPLSDFWKKVSKEVTPETTDAIASQPVPNVGDVIVTGVVIAGSDDLTDTIYVESPDRAWGTRVSAPMGVSLVRGDLVKITGKLELRERAAKHIVAASVDRLSTDKVPGPLGMSNLYVGDGYRSGRATDLSNLGILVRSWGRVKTVDPVKNLFVIDDGSSSDGLGLVVYAGKMTRSLSFWPRVGQYICVTGVSMTWAGEDGSMTSGLRLRSENDLQVLVEQ